MTLCPLSLSIAPLELGSPPVISLDLVKQHCSIDGDDFDVSLTLYLRASIAWAENAMHRTVFSRQHRWVLRDFPYDGYGWIRLPRGLCSAVDHITYAGAGGEGVVLHGPSSPVSPAGTDWQEDLSSDDGGLIRPARVSSWPSVDLEAVSPVTIVFDAGWQANAVPADVIHAILFGVSDMFDVRGSADLTSFGKNLETRNSLVSPYALHRWY